MMPVNFRMVRRFAATVEIGLGVCGMALLIMGGLLLPVMGIVLLFSAVPLFLLSYIGRTELRTLEGTRPFDANTGHVIILTLILVGAVLVLPYRHMAGGDYDVPAVSFALWPFFGAFARLPGAIKIGLLLLLAAHACAMAFMGSRGERSARTRMVRGLAVAAVAFVLINIVRFAALASDYRSLLDLTGLEAAVVGGGRVFKEAFVLDASLEQRADAMSDSLLSFHIAGASPESSLLVRVGMGMTPASAQERYRDKVDQFQRYVPRVERFPIQVPEGEGVLIKREPGEHVRYRATARKGRTNIEVTYVNGSESEPDIAFTDFEAALNAVLSHTATR